MRPERHSGLISVQDYLALEETSEVRHEFVDGKIFAMSGATKSHNLNHFHVQEDSEVYCW